MGAILPAGERHPKELCASKTEAGKTIRMAHIYHFFALCISYVHPLLLRGRLALSPLWTRAVKKAEMK